MKEALLNSYSVLEANNDLRKVRHLQYNSGNGWGLDFLMGHPIEETISENSILVTFECKKTDLPDYFEVDGAPVANHKLINAFEEAGTSNFQAFPVDLHFENGIVSGYYIFNIIGLISCIDLEATKCTKFGPSIARILDLKLKSESDYNATMFRDQKYKEIIFISENIKNRIEKNSITGCDIRTAEGWNDSHRF